MHEHGSIASQVLFWIVERSREIAERKKNGANERIGGGGGRGGGDPKSLFVYLSLPQSTQAEALRFVTHSSDDPLESLRGIQGLVQVQVQVPSQTGPTKWSLP